MIKRMGITILAAVLAHIPLALADTGDGEKLSSMSWDQIVAEARGSEVNWFLWGGSDNINRYVTEYIGGILKDRYDITLNRVGLSDTVAAVNIVLGEKESGVMDEGSVDMIWING
ncbi:MAG: ABC transporter substrate-binding protein, partial [Alphaproteobacteria bacterium]